MNNMNQAFGGVFYFLNKPSIIREYFTKEIDHTIKYLNSVEQPDLNLGFVQMNGKEALKMRAIFNEFFMYDRIKNLSYKMGEIQDRVIKKQIEELGLNRDKFVEIDLKKFLGEIMINWNALLLFGCESAEEMEVDLTPFPEITSADFPMHDYKDKKSTNLVNLASHFIECCIYYEIDVVNIFLSYMPSKYGLFKRYRDHKK